MTLDASLTIIFYVEPFVVDMTSTEERSENSAKTYVIDSRKFSLPDIIHTLACHTFTGKIVHVLITSTSKNAEALRVL